MTATAESILSNLLTLSEEDRLEIADRLQSSVYGPPGESEDVELSDEMKATLDRRWEEIESGKVECIPHEQVMAKLKAKYGF
ncbi:putative addiction module component, TIGR02574 family [Prosthecobacter debontii]|uniref:Putative addiction module component, TIGR02574 family n=1 Tax=Prosthecobacter debontii TaxID=48467 RepID=A0A1T4Y0G5_9BACT|nr:addiction module protein [Prosthecobacter debontii]SKA95270.1 putative addiction module component, TIGR02574 family [Prosthecobacter debontii]